MISRRDILKSLTIGAVTGSVLRVIPVEAAEHAHHMVAEDKASAPKGVYVPKYFSEHQYKMLSALCQTIIPPDQEVGGAIEAGTPEFIDLITSENPEYQVALSGGMMWLDHACMQRYEKAYMDCTPEQQKEALDLIAYSANGKKDPTLTQGIEFFTFLRNLTLDGFFTSKIGIEYLKYMGNAFLTSFTGCPPVPGLEA